MLQYGGNRNYLLLNVGGHCYCCGDISEGDIIWIKFSGIRNPVTTGVLVHLNLIRNIVVSYY